MKKQFAILVCAAFAFACLPAIAADVGKSPTKTEVSVQSLSDFNISVSPMVFEIGNFETLVVFSEVNSPVIFKAEKKINYMAPVVSMPEGDAAIPIPAQANFYSTKKMDPLQCKQYTYKLPFIRYLSCDIA